MNNTLSMLSIIMVLITYEGMYVLFSIQNSTVSIVLMLIKQNRLKRTQPLLKVGMYTLNTLTLSSRNQYHLVYLKYYFDITAQSKHKQRDLICKVLFIVTLP